MRFSPSAIVQVGGILTTFLTTWSLHLLLHKERTKCTILQMNTNHNRKSHVGVYLSLSHQNIECSSSKPQPLRSVYNN